MRILQVHNYYQQSGGEDMVVAAEYELLNSYGHEVLRYTRRNDEVKNISALQLLEKTVFNRATEREVSDLLVEASPDIIHAHNTFPLISPSVYYAAANAGIPVIQTLHNFRLLCPAAVFLRNGKICEDCLGHVPYPAVLHSCYRGNRGASTAAVAMITAHRLLGTWRNKVHTFISLTNFAKSKFVEGGMDPDKLTVKPNFLSEDPGIGDGSGEYALFASRLSGEKGLHVLLDAWDQLECSIPLKIAGDGELKPWLMERARGKNDIEILGRRGRAETMRLMKEAALVIVPSECYENLPMTIVEAFACGTPVLTSHLVSMDELVIDGITGGRFRSGSPTGLAQRVVQLWRSSDLRSKMRQAARSTYERRYTPAINYPQLMKIYHRAMEAAGTLKARSAYETR